MKLPRIFSNQQFKRMAIAIAFFLFIFVTINIFIIGGDLFVFTFNSSLNSPLAIIIAVSAAMIWRLMSVEQNNRFLWSGILLGWVLWALAETIWGIYSILGQEVPYPSLADLFWIIGYFPLGIGLLIRIRTMPTQPNRLQNIVIWVTSVITVLITIFFIFIPIFQSFDPQRLLESILNLIYPLADLFLVIIVWRLFFTYEEGDYGFSWRLLTLGFILMTISDLIFTYTSWQGLYYPDMKATFISRMAVDVPYSISYVLWFIGLYVLRIKMKEVPYVEPVSRVRMVRTYGHILIYTKNDNTVIDVSPNFGRLLEAVSVRGKSLAQALTISEQDGRAILEQLKRKGRVADLPIQIHDNLGVIKEVSLCGLAVIDPQNVYMGANILLRMRVADPSFDDGLGQESRSMTRHVLEQSGSNNKAEIGQFLADYYLAYIKSLLNMAFHQGGEATSQALLDQLLKTTQKNNWQMQFNLQTVLDSTNYPVDLLREALPILLETAKQFVSEITGPVIVEARMREVHSQFSQTVHRDVARYKNARNYVGFSDHRRGYPDEQH